jgi:hypothetical protein
MNGREKEREKEGRKKKEKRTERAFKGSHACLAGSALGFQWLFFIPFNQKRM